MVSLPVVEALVLVMLKLLVLILLLLDGLDGDQGEAILLVLVKGFPLNLIPEADRASIALIFLQIWKFFHACIR